MMGFVGIRAYRKRITDALVIVALGVVLVALVMFPEQTVSAAQAGLSLCANTIVPSLFPFFVLSSMIAATGVTKHLRRLLEPVMRPLFNVGGGCVAAFALGFVGGYPVGARTVISMYENGSCSEVEAERLLSFCNNSGPAFIFGIVGAGVFSSGKIGLLLYLIHSVASIIVGILFRNWGKNPPLFERCSAAQSVQTVPFLKAFSGGVQTAVASSLNICGFVIFFTIFIKLLFFSGLLPAIAGFIGTIFAPVGFDKAWAERLLTGIIELTSGVWTLKGVEGQITGSVAMAAFMLGWAGLSVHSQVLSFIGESGLSVKTYIIGKFLQGVISAGLVLIVSRVMTLDIPAAYLAQQVSEITSLGFLNSLLISSIGAATILTAILIASWHETKRRNRT